MNKRIITISRQFGSGGRTVAKLVAEKLGIPYYDKEIVRRATLETGFDEMFVSEMGECASVKSALSFIVSAKKSYGEFNGMSAEDYLWVSQCKIINQFAAEGPCVIVGRCSDYVLRERDDCLNVFIYADKQFRAEHILKKYGPAKKSIEKRINEKDERRKKYYRHYTNRDWENIENYHLSLNSGELGIDLCADLIAYLFNKD